MDSDLPDGIGAEPRYLFFLSYSRDDSDPYLLKFFDELNFEVARLMGLPRSQQAGFLDRTAIDLGDSWPSTLAQAVATASVLVSVYSPSYFRKEYCGKEFAVFQRRQQSSAGRTDAILPVLWYPAQAHIPAHLQSIQYSHQGLGDLYVSKGLQHLRKLKTHASVYSDIIRFLAERIAAAARTPIPALLPPPALDSVVSAFTAHDAPVAAVAPSSSGPSTATFIYVTRGDTARTWAPYPPPDRNQIWSLSFATAMKRWLYPQELPFDDLLLDRLQRARKQNEIVVLLVNGSALQDLALQRRIQQYDETNFANCAALVIWPSDLGPTDEARVSRWIRDAFPNNGARSRPTWFRGAIRTLEDLNTALDETLRALQMEILSRADDPAAPSTTKLPELTVPLR